MECRLMYNEYFPKAIKQDWPLVIEALQILGMLDADEHMTEECAAWVIVGAYPVPTGETRTDPETGQAVAVTAPLTDENGNEYVHGNLTTTVDIFARAQEMAAEYPLLAEALSNLPRFIVVDADGKPKRPSRPMNVRAGA